MAKDKFGVFSSKIIDLVGGKENIAVFTHCATRLRFNVENKEKVQFEEVKNLPGARGAVWAGNQLQIIIGNDVADAYAAICKAAGLNADDSIGETQKGGKFSVGAIIDGIAGCVTPIIPVLVGSGLIKILVMLGEMSGLLSADAPTHTVLTFASDAGFYFLPIFVGFAAARKFGANPALGMLMGAIFIHPTFIAAIEAGTTLSIFGLPIYGASYAASIFPVILSVFVMSYVERFAIKISPDFLRSVVEPLLTLIVMIPIALCVLGPMGAFLGNYMAAAILWLYEKMGWLAVGLSTALAPLFIITGIHHAFTPYIFQSFADLGYEPIVLVGNIIYNLNLGIICLVAGLKMKDKDEKSTSLSCAVTSLTGGISEPGMYGVIIKNKRLLVSLMAGSFVGGAIAGFGKVCAYAFAGSFGIFGLTAYIGDNVLWLITALVISFAVSITMTTILFKDKKSAGDSKAPKDTTPLELKACISGSVIPVADVDDPVFSSKTLGDGIAIRPSGQIITAPCAGKVSMIADTLHAIGITMDNGAELLIHEGINTVALEGKGFKVLVKAGDTVKVGTPLLEFDAAFIKEHGYATDCVMIVTNSEDFPNVKFITGINAQQKETVVCQF
ncbi:MAG: glucose PTS transporter subunit IIA [Oscillospiraceae bacterium]|nr:glucose PTS transporter subunit IIA [Oscillospiraceae bacterium]